MSHKTSRGASLYNSQIFEILEHKTLRCFLLSEYQIFTIFYDIIIKGSIKKKLHSGVGLQDECLLQFSKTCLKSTFLF